MNVLRSWRMLEAVAVSGGVVLVTALLILFIRRLQSGIR